MSEDDAFQNLPECDEPLLFECLKPRFPLSVHAYYFIDNIIKWKKKVPQIDMAVLTPRGGYKTGAVFFYVSLYNSLVCSAYVWTKEGSGVLQNALVNTKRFKWKEYRTLLISCMTKELWSIIEPVIPEILKDRPNVATSYDKVFWLPVQDVLNFDYKVPEGMYVGELKKEHIQMVNDVWPHKEEGSDKLMEMMLDVNFGRGLFKSDGTLVSWAFYWFFGALGVFQTAENEKRKGYGKIIAQAVSKEMGSLGLDVHLNIVGGNVASENLFRSLGFKLAYDCVWIFSFNKTP